MNPAFWKNKKVLLTGHTGFKGSWLSLWLQQLGADVSGYSIGVPTDPSLFESAAAAKGMNSKMGDVRDLANLSAYVKKTVPDIVIHMAAQSLVRRSYADPVGTYDTNIMGTVNVLEAARNADSVRVVIIVTSDKCYAIGERQGGCRENEPMGGHDPYSSSKGCAELVTAAYRHSFVDRGAAIASVRAGNVIGGGDWAEDRLVPDIVAAFRQGVTPEIRHPKSVRPWQFVMDPLNGYLILAEKLWEDAAAFEGAWNFGPDDADSRDVAHVVDRLSSAWGASGAWQHNNDEQPPEAQYLALDSSKARSGLGWLPMLDLSTTLDWIVEWYRNFNEVNDARDITIEQIDRFQHLVNQS